ncbi:MAG: hypothetical protein IPM13_01215 [Phycisphaerales bacterium]|nr:hypothetical protein [Phycisphaerales bacterium]
MNRSELLDRIAKDADYSSNAYLGVAVREADRLVRVSPFVHHADPWRLGGCVGMQGESVGYVWGALIGDDRRSFTEFWCAINCISVSIGAYGLSLGCDGMDLVTFAIDTFVAPTDADDPEMLAMVYGRISAELREHLGPELVAELGESASRACTAVLRLLDSLHSLAKLDDHDLKDRELSRAIVAQAKSSYMACIELTPALLKCLMRLA